jgi:DNA-binding XRE family transcriptional regulator
MTFYYDLGADGTGFAIFLGRISWRRGTLLHPFCRLVLRAVRVVPPPWVLDPTIRSQTLKNYRLQAKLSQMALANKLGVTLSAVARWEQGKATPNRKTWRALWALLPLGRGVFLSPEFHL